MGTWTSETQTESRFSKPCRFRKAERERKERKRKQKKNKGKK